jgi:hypothetical protein
MGNRGILHNQNNEIVRPWAHQNWVSCLMKFKEIKRRPFSAGNYSELFFLDEATAFAAGHRPCAHCQYQRHKEFKEAWLSSNRHLLGGVAKAGMKEVDRFIHQERAISGSGRAAFFAKLSELPLGVMFEYEGQAFLVSERGFLLWSFEGYSAPQKIDDSSSVLVLTPQSIVRAFASGFVPRVHGSANVESPVQNVEAGKQEIRGSDPNKLIERMYQRAKEGKWDELLREWNDSPELLNRCSRHSNPGSGWTFLHQAAWFGNEKACRLLIGRGSSIEALSKDQKTPYHVAESQGQPRLAEFLKRASMKPNSLWSPPTDPDVLPSSNCWSEAQELVAPAELVVAYGGGLVRIPKGKRYFADSLGRVLVGWRGTYDPPSGMDGESMVGQRDAARQGC